MAFDADERARLLGTKGVGPTVIARLEQIGYNTLAQRSQAGVTHITGQVAAMLDTTFWRNSPQASGAIAAAIDTAKQQPDAA